MSNLVFGVGIGLFAILILWLLALVVFIVSLRLEKNLGAFAILIVSICTIILFTLPRTSYKPSSIDKRHDNLFIWRMLLLILLIISCIIGIFTYIKFALITPIRPIRISTWIL